MIDVADWTPADGLTLEPNGLVAVRSTVNIALTAGPGSGKTEVLAQRCDYLLRRGVCPYPRRVLAISAKRDARTNLADRVRERCGDTLADRLDSFAFHAFGKSIIDRFRPVLTGVDALSLGYLVGKKRVPGEQIRYEDMVPLAVKILEASPVALRAIRQTYSHLLLDEFQDCTDKQYQLIRVAFCGTPTVVTAVGDTKQRIMRWAGAMDGVFKKLEDDFSATSLNLYINRRSQVRLRRMQNEMVKVMEPPAAVADADLQGTGGVANHLHFDSEVDEGVYLAEMIRGWIKDEKIPPSKIAVLVSKQPALYARDLFANFDRFGVPYRDEQTLQDLVKEPMFNLLNDYLRVVFGSREPRAYSRLLRTVIAPGASEVLDFRQRARWASHILSCARDVDGMPLQAQIEKASSSFVRELGTDFLRGLSVEYAHGNYFDDVWGQCLDNIRRVSERSSGMEELLASLDNDESVKVMTIHKSKGLEYHSVVVLSVEPETFWGDPIDERSAFFVGISRAKERLVLTTAARRSWPPDAWKWDVQRSQHGEFLQYLYSSESCIGPLRE